MIVDHLRNIRWKPERKQMYIEEDRAFLLSQRKKGHPGSIGLLGMVEIQRTRRAQAHVDAELRQKRRAEEEMEASASQVVLTSTSKSIGSSTTGRRRKPWTN